MLDEARRFYEALQTTPDLLTGIPALGPEDVDAALALVTAAELADDHKTEATGESALVAPSSPASMPSPPAPRETPKTPSATRPSSAKSSASWSAAPEPRPAGGSFPP